MTEVQLKDTKEKILAAGRTLFSEKGFEGASIRDIAKLADVNIAAVNYHYTSKENLFNEVIGHIFSETANAIRQRREVAPDECVEDFAIWIFRLFLERSDALRAVFKMMLSEQGWNDDMECGDEDEPFGPPGGMSLAEAITSELKHPISEDNMFWAVKIVFSHVVHISLMYSNHFCKKPQETMAPFHDQATLEKDIRRLVNVVIKDLRI